MASHPPFFSRKRRETSHLRMIRDSLSERIECWFLSLDFVQLALSYDAIAFASLRLCIVGKSNLHSSRESMNMGVDPNLTVLVYENGMGVYIHRLFAEKHRITPGAEVHPSVLLRHEQEIPHSERARMKSWIHPDDRKFMETRLQNPVFWGHIDPPIQSKVESS